VFSDGAIRRIPLLTLLTVSTIAAAGAEVGEGANIPVSSFAFAASGLDTGITPQGGEIAGVPAFVSDQAPAPDSSGHKAFLRTGCRASPPIYRVGPLSNNINIEYSQ
jgi:hypothetical protein